MRSQLSSALPLCSVVDGSGMNTKEKTIKTVTEKPKPDKSLTMQRLFGVDSLLERNRHKSRTCAPGRD